MWTHVDAGGEGGGAGASRVETMMPLIRRFFQITIVVISIMIMLSSLGINIGPLIAGAGVVGLAVGFGAQTLVTDVISGLFYLIDDAFRTGEYVDIGVVKGRVEKMNVRSLVLRHHRGALNTVPYSEIKHLKNYSRDWVIMKLVFRVTYDTDVNQVKKIFKKIGQDLLADPVLGPGFIEPFKSQGVLLMEDSAMIVRGKFMAKPGEQFMIRNEIYNRVQKAFDEDGIKFAHRRVLVHMARPIVNRTARMSPAPPLLQRPRPTSGLRYSAGRPRQPTQAATMASDWVPKITQASGRWVVLDSAPTSNVVSAAVPYCTSPLIEAAVPA